MKAEKGELIPIASLKDDAPIDHAEEPTTTEPQRIAPFQDRPLAVFEEILNDASHRGLLELLREHLPDVLPPNDFVSGDLVVHGIVGVELGQRRNVCAVKRLNPAFDNLPWSHDASSVALLARGL
jgi:hypothetical protein